MSYSIETYDKAQSILDRRKERATLEAQDRADELCAKIPELNTINRKLAQIGLNISKTFFASQNPKEDIDRLRTESLALQEEKKNLLKKNGYSENALAIKYTCPACEDTGFIGGRRCKCFINLLKDIEREKIEKIAPLEECTFETFNTEYYPNNAENGEISPRRRAEKIKENCIRYATNFSKNSKSLFFMGGTGLGKTHLSLAIANVAINKGYSVIYGTAQNILGDLQNENFGRLDNLKYRENEILDVDLLILDDLGTEFKNAYT
ncbi:MAG: ATP-binding protein, partial [Clostridiales bacterium]